MELPGDISITTPDYTMHRVSGGLKNMALCQDWEIFIADWHITVQVFVYPRYIVCLFWGDNPTIAV